VGRERVDVATDAQSPASEGVLRVGGAEGELARGLEIGPEHEVGVRGRAAEDARAIRGHDDVVRCLGSVRQRDALLEDELVIARANGQSLRSTRRVVERGDPLG